MREGKLQLSSNTATGLHVIANTSMIAKRHEKSSLKDSAFNIVRILSDLKYSHKFAGAQEQRWSASVASSQKHTNGELVFILRILAIFGYIQAC